MPQRLLKTGSVELNYIAARGDGRVYLAFSNQSREAVSTEVAFNADVFPAATRGRYTVKVIADGKPAKDVMLRDGRFPIQVSAMGQSAVVIEGLKVAPRFQHKLLAADADQAWKKDFAEINYGGARAMILNFGPAAKTAYVYLQADDSEFKEVTLNYMVGERETSLRDAAYPFEFTVPLATDATDFRFQLKGLTVDGRSSASEKIVLQR